MMRPFGKMVLTLGALALMASPAWAQGRGGFGFGSGAFLMAPNVQKDMKLSEEQVGKVQETLREVREKHQDDFAALRDASEDQRAEKMRALNKATSEEIKKALALTDEQSKRFDQISLQTSGLQAFADPKVAEKLKLTGEQNSKIRELAGAGRRGGGAFNKDASKEERAEAFRKMQETQRENFAKVQAMLTDDQKTAWKEMTGTPIVVEYQRRGN